MQASDEGRADVSADAPTLAANADWTPLRKDAGRRTFSAVRRRTCQGNRPGPTNLSTKPSRPTQDSSASDEEPVSEAGQTEALSSATADESVSEARPADAGSSASDDESESEAELADARSSVFDEEPLGEAGRTEALSSAAADESVSETGPIDAISVEDGDEILR